MPCKAVMEVHAREGETRRERAIRLLVDYIAETSEINRKRAAERDQRDLEDDIEICLAEQAERQAETQAQRRPRKLQRTNRMRASNHPYQHFCATLSCSNLIQMGNKWCRECRAIPHEEE